MQETQQLDFTFLLRVLKDHFKQILIINPRSVRFVPTLKSKSNPSTVWEPVYSVGFLSSEEWS